MTDIELKNIKKGDLLICKDSVNSLYLKKNNVVTFSNYHEDTPYYFQLKELFDFGLDVHNHPYNEFELFDESIHTDFLMVTNKILAANKESNPWF
jgi:hypothetical protein